MFQLLTPDGESLATPCPPFMFQELSTPGLCAFSSACCPQLLPGGSPDAHLAICLCSRKVSWTFRSLGYPGEAGLPLEGGPSVGLSVSGWPAEGLSALICTMGW